MAFLTACAKRDTVEKIVQSIYYMPVHQQGELHETTQPNQ